MEIKLKVNIKPFSVPNYVVAEAEARPRQEGFSEMPSIHLSDLDADTVHKLCDDFTRAVFKKAGVEYITEG